MRKPPGVHDTHHEFSKMPKLTPAELSRMKADKEQREYQEVKRRNEELVRQQIARDQTLRMQNNVSKSIF